MISDTSGAEIIRDDFYVSLNATQEQSERACDIFANMFSVDECFNELEAQFSKDLDAFKWINERKHMFKNPDSAESLIIRDLFKNPKMRESIHTKNILANRPSADIYIAVKAKQLQAKVVTAEEYKPHSAQLPNICENLGVSCITFDDFMDCVTQRP